jgi:hypothetical protein
MFTPRLVTAVSLLGLLACSESSSRHIAESVAEGVADGVASEKSSAGDHAAAASAGDGVSGLDVRVRGRRGDAADAQPTFAEGPGGTVSMHTTNGAFVMSLRNDSVLIAFSDSIREHVRAELADKSQRRAQEASAKDRSAIGNLVQGVVQKTVAATMSEVFDHARGFPVSVLRDVSYERGEIQFDFHDKPTWNFQSFKSDDVPLLAQFHPADAARFVGAVRSRLKRG